MKNNNLEDEKHFYMREGKLGKRKLEQGQESNKMPYIKK